MTVPLRPEPIWDKEMILTGSEIAAEYSAGRITLNPYSADQLNPNSYNYRLGNTLKVPHIGRGNKVEFEDQPLGEEGFVLQPRTVYLGATFELIGSNTYAMSLIGRSSLGRLGLFLQVSADLGHTGSAHHWTLELVAVKPLRIYPYMTVGQVTFWCNRGKIPKNASFFAKQHLPTESQFRAGWCQ